MSSSAASVLSGDLSGYSLDEAVHAMLQAAALQAREVRCDCLGMEHLLAAILKHENGQDPGHTFLQTLRVDTASLHRTATDVARRVRGAAAPARVALRSDTHSILAAANE